MSASSSMLRFVCRAAMMVVALLAVSPTFGQTNHTVTSGDTLDSIGKKYDVTPAAIAAYNNLDNPNLIVPGSVLKIPPPPGTPVPYTVKSGDTLGSIAIAHGASIKAVTDLNSLADPDNLKVGEVLMVPSAPVTAPAERYPLPAALRKRLDGIPVRAGRWKYIVVHHSASKSGTMKGMDMYHRQKRHMENGLAYHFVIGNGNGIPNGRIEIGDRWLKQIRGGHLASDKQNEVAIGICLVGNFETAPPNESQMRSLYALVSYLRQRCGIAKHNVKTHTQINQRPTACPGRKFPTDTFIRNL